MALPSQYTHCAILPLQPQHKKAMTVTSVTIPKFRYLSAWFCPFAHRTTLALEHHAGRVEYEWIEVMRERRKNTDTSLSTVLAVWNAHMPFVLHIYRRLDGNNARMRTMSQEQDRSGGIIISLMNSRDAIHLLWFPLSFLSIATLENRMNPKVSTSHW